jgi:DNA-binding CsgD family transcriptional regulator
MNFATFCDDDLDPDPLIRTAPGVVTPPKTKPFADLSDFADSAARQHAMQRAIYDVGFDWLCYCKVQRIGERLTNVAWFTTYSPPGWATRYHEEGLSEIDPRIPFACRYDWPIVWDLDSLFRVPTDAWTDVARRSFIASAIDMGVRSGITFGLPGSLLFERAIVTVSSHQPHRRWITDTIVGQAYGLGTLLHAYIEPRARSMLPTLSREALSDAQVTLLRYVTEGLSTREIAVRVNRSVHTVAWQLKRLEETYCAQNRAQLAYIAGRILQD